MPAKTELNTGGGDPRDATDEGRVSTADTTFANHPMWRSILQSPVTRLIVLGAAMLYFMGWAESRLSDFNDRPLLNVAIQIGLGLAAIAVYVAYGNTSNGATSASFQRPVLAVNGPSAR